MEEFITIKENVQAQIIEKKSKFIANLFYIEDIKQAEEIIRDTKKKYFDARHNCIAYRIIDNGQVIEKSSDDGEPSGTAGAPMLNILQKNSLVNVLVIVTRYFGGVLLGTGGLVRAYSNSLLLALESSIKVKKCLGNELIVNLEYNELENFKYYCKNNDINIKSINYSDNITLKMEMEKNRKNIFLEDIETKKLNVQYFQVVEEKYINKTVEKNK